MNRTLLAAALLCTSAAAVPSFATHPVAEPEIVVFMSGLQEVGPDGTLGVGDPDGTAVARLFGDHGDLVYLIDYNNISGEAVSGLHIHGPGATPLNNRPVFIDLVTELRVPPPLPAGSISGRVRGIFDPTVAPKIQQVFANPQEFYINLHTSGAGGFPSGAVRGQLPEPSAAGACAVAGAAVLLRRRPRRDGIR